MSMSYVDTEKLIIAVKKRPALYKKDDELYYSHRKNKDKIWHEICEEINRDWEKVNANDKADYVREIQKRWKSLRTCFSRELSLQRKEKKKRETDQYVKRRKRYEYFNNLIFLIDECDDNDVNDRDDGRDSDDSIDPLDSSVKDEYPAYGPESPSDDTNVQNIKHEIESPQLQTFQQEKVQSRNKFNQNTEDKILDMLKDFKKEEKDEDRLFMLSLVPTLRQLNAKQKMSARIQILQILQSISNQDS